MFLGLQLTVAPLLILSKKVLLSVLMVKTGPLLGADNHTCRALP
jgi:hypothetical protein